MRATIAILATFLITVPAVAQHDDPGPFTHEEAELMSAVWPEIREAESFDDIDWRAAGLASAPGDARARRLMAEHWGTLREAGRFSDIDWEATIGY